MYKLKLFSIKRIGKNPLHEKCCKTKHNISWCWKLIFSNIKLSNLWRLEWYFQNQKVIIKVITINILQKWLALQFLLSVKFIRNISWNKRKWKLIKITKVNLLWQKYYMTSTPAQFYSPLTSPTYLQTPNKTLMPQCFN